MLYLMYNTNCALSQVLLSQRNGTVVKYIYGVGLIGEERHGYFQTYHYDYRGSTIAITNECGELTFTFEYDTYGKLLNEYDYSDAIFLYNGRDGVITDKNGLVYMRARYYSPEMKRFINADIIPGEISDSTSLNRYAYVNGNPVSLVDPTGYIGIFTLMLIGAGIGAVCGAIGSIVGQAIESKINNEEFKLDAGELISDTVWGAVDGAIAFSPIKVKARPLVQAGVSLLHSVTNELVDDEEGFNVTRALKSTASDIALDLTFDSIGLDFAKDIDIANASKHAASTIAEFTQRSNSKWADKQIKRVRQIFKLSLSNKAYGELFNGVFGVGADAILQNIDGYIDKGIVLPNYLDNGYVIMRK